MKRKGGAPTKYRPEYCELLKLHCEAGGDYQSFAAKLGVHFDTLYEWEKVHPEFSEAKKIGRAKMYAWWFEAGQKGMYNETIKDGDGMTVTRSINSTIYVWMTKNILGWKDKQEIEAKVQHEELNPVQSLVDELKALREADKK